MGITAIFGGTFNPFHIGHYEMLKALQEDENIEEIWIMPDNIPPHKVCDFLAGNSARIEMCKIAAEDFKKAKVCLIEFEREGKSYSYDTVLELKQKFPQRQFAFVCGGDMFISFDKWYRYEELMKLVDFIVFKRSDTDVEVFSECVKRFSKMGMNITVKEEEIPNVSSTQFRKSNLYSLLPEKIYKYIKDSGIYNV